MIQMMDGYSDNGIALLDGRLRMDLALHLSQRKRASAFGTSHNQPQLALSLASHSHYTVLDLTLHRLTSRHRTLRVFDICCICSLHLLPGGKEKKKRCARMGLVLTRNSYYPVVRITTRNHGTEESLCDGL